MQAQQGVLKPPKQHTLIQIYNFDSLPLIVMNVARIGAQIPGMACELESEPFNDRSKKRKMGVELVQWLVLVPWCGF